MRSAFIILSLVLAVAARPARFSARQQKSASLYMRDLSDEIAAQVAEATKQALEQAGNGGGSSVTVAVKNVTVTNGVVDAPPPPPPAEAAPPPAAVPPPPPPPPPPAAGAPADAAALQTSLTLDPSVICTNFTDDGQNPPVAGQTASLTSTNNYINFCALTLPKTPLTNGGQITTGSCNPAPIGLIPSVDKMPSAKFTFPKNFGTIDANKPFNATLQMNNLVTGVFTNAQKTYFAAPQTLDASGNIIGHTHMVIETLTALDQILPLDPKGFFFFKGVDDAGVGGVQTVLVAQGVPAGAYRICSINSSANHQPVIVPIAQHGSLDDCSYFTAK
ncbi:hypothetical protein DFH09DRAFT_1275277 [Mycena vulgaris]|nr:hypothetical protein DFH09DRAFT_1275277 [Mycena vulgaris]